MYRADPETRNFGSRCRLAAPLRRAMRGRGVLGVVGRSDARKDQSALGLVGVLDAPDPASWKTEIGWPIFRSDA